MKNLFSLIKPAFSHFLSVARTSHLRISGIAGSDHRFFASFERLELVVAHGGKNQHEIAEDFDSGRSEPRALLVAVESEDHDDAHQEGEEGACDREVGGGSDHAHADEDGVEEHDVREPLDDHAADRLEAAFFPFLVLLGFLLVAFSDDYAGVGQFFGHGQGLGLLLTSLFVLPDLAFVLLRTIGLIGAKTKLLRIYLP